MRSASTHQSIKAYRPVHILEMEIGDQLQPIEPADDTSGNRYTTAWIVVRLHSRPLGIVEVELDPDQLSAEACAKYIWEALNREIVAHLREDGLPPVSSLTPVGISAPDTPACIRERNEFLSSAPFVSVIIPTRDRVEHLRRCIATVVSLEYPAGRWEVLIVDNAPKTTATAEFVDTLANLSVPVRYVLAKKPGLSHARNCGLQEVKGEFVAFTDDDVSLDRYWLAELMRGFTRADWVGCVTGILLPGELETEAQILFEQHGAFVKGFSRQIFDLTEYRIPDRLYPYRATVFGAGASMAFPRSILAELGEFDPALGAGSIAKGGEDLDYLFRVITAGLRIVYEPGALAYHVHRREYAALRSLLTDYGVGLSSYLTKIVISNRLYAFNLLKAAPSALFFALAGRNQRQRGRQIAYPRELPRSEIKGFIRGPIAYFQSRRSLYRDRL